MTADWIALAAFLGLVLGGFALAINRVGLPKYGRRPLVTDSELRFYFRLVSALPRECKVFPQVSMGALLQPLAWTSKGRLAGFRRVSQKRCDFVVVDAALRVRFVVELDDHTHDVAADKERDALLQGAGIRTIRIDVRRQPRQPELEAELLRCLGEGWALC